MRTYGKRFLNNFRLRESRNSRETKNAIVWSIDEDNRKANVRIQGSNTTISAFFPTSWHTRPEWCKIGAPVRILFSGGNRGIIELLGPGTVIPYPQTGQVWPGDVVVRPNQILSGLKVIPIPNIKTNAVMVKTGSALIGNVEVTVDAIMLNNDIYTLAMGGYLGEIAAVFETPIFNDLEYPLQQYKISKIYLTDEGEICIISGNLFSCYLQDNAYYTIFDWVVMDYLDFSDYIFPEAIDPPIPQDSIELASIVAFNKGVEIHAININWKWKLTRFFIYGREPMFFVNESLDAELDWGESVVWIELRGIDNTGGIWSNGKTYTMKASIVSGTGEISDAFCNPPEWGVTCVCTSFYDPLDAVHYPYFYIRYKRDNLVTDISPTIKYELVIDNAITGFCSVELFDAAGDPMH